MVSRGRIAVLAFVVGCTLLLGTCLAEAETNGGYKDVTYPVVGNTGLDAEGFVRASGNKFTINGCDFVFAGFNVWQAVELGSNLQVNRGNPKPGREHLTNILNEAASSGLKVMRVWAHTIRPERPLQPSPGQYDEEVFQGLDWINDECSKRGLKVIWMFADNWYDVGGVKQYEQWSGGDFFDSGAKELYKNNILKLLTRVNAINGRVYRDDPTIMAWNLANELRCKNCPSSTMQSWINEMCSYVKSVDSNHMVGIGQEGFHGPGSDLKDSNPATWAAREGQDFVSNHQEWCVDYVGFHVWPDNWELVSTQFQKDFIRTAVENSNGRIGKPVIMEEFGKIGDEGTRNEFMNSAYSVVEESVESGGPLRGALFYHWYDAGIGPGSYGIWSTSSTFDIITKNARYMESKSTC